MDRKEIIRNGVNFRNGVSHDCLIHDPSFRFLGHTSRFTVLVICDILYHRVLNRFD